MLQNFSTYSPPRSEEDPMSWWGLLVSVADSLLTERSGFTRSPVCAAVEGGLPFAHFHGSVGSSPSSPRTQDSRHSDESRTDDVLAGTWVHQEGPRLFCLRAHIRHWQVWDSGHFNNEYWLLLHSVELWNSEDDNNELWCTCACYGSGVILDALHAFFFFIQPLNNCTSTWSPFYRWGHWNSDWLGLESTPQALRLCPALPPFDTESFSTNLHLFHS